MRFKDPNKERNKINKPKIRITPWRKIIGHPGILLRQKTSGKKWIENEENKENNRNSDLIEISWMHKT